MERPNISGKDILAVIVVHKQAQSFYNSAIYAHPSTLSRVPEDILELGIDSRADQSKGSASPARADYCSGSTTPNMGDATG